MRFAGGAGLMAACDLAVAAETARIGYPEVKRGLVPRSSCTTCRVRSVTADARELLLTGEPITAEIAIEWGLVKLVTPQERLSARGDPARAGASGCGPEAIATTKRLLDEAAGTAA